MLYEKEYWNSLMLSINDNQLVCLLLIDKQDSSGGNQGFRELNETLPTQWVSQFKDQTLISD